MGHGAPLGMVRVGIAQACAVIAAVAVLALAAALSEAFAAHLDDFVIDRMRAWDTPGVSLVVVSDGEVRSSRGYGYADREAGRRSGARCDATVPPGEPSEGGEEPRHEVTQGAGDPSSVVLTAHLVHHPAGVDAEPRHGHGGLRRPSRQQRRLAGACWHVRRRRGGRG